MAVKKNRNSKKKPESELETNAYIEGAGQVVDEKITATLEKN